MVYNTQDIDRILEQKLVRYFEHNCVEYIGLNDKNHHIFNLNLNGTKLTMSVEYIFNLDDSDFEEIALACIEGYNEYIENEYIKSAFTSQPY